MKTNSEALLLKLKEFDSQLPELIDRYRFEYQGKLEPLHPAVLVRHIEHGIMVAISRAALLEIIKALEETNTTNTKIDDLWLLDVIQSHLLGHPSYRRSVRIEGVQHLVECNVIKPNQPTREELERRLEEFQQRNERLFP